MFKKEIKFTICGKTISLNWYFFVMLAVMTLGLIFLIWRAPYGHCYHDEPFIITLAQRLYQGDALLADEWHGTQLFGGVLLPFYAIFRLFSDSNEGIIMVFRYTYCVLWWFTCSALCLKFSKKYKSAVFAFIYLILFSPLDNMILSYTTFGMMCALVISYILYHVSLSDRKPKIGVTLAFSVCWVVLVLSSPFMAVGYVGLFLVAVVGTFIEKKRKTGFAFHQILHMYKWSWAISIVSAIAYVIAFIASRTDITTAFDNIRYIMADPEHPSISFFGAIAKNVKEFYMMYPAYIIVSAVVMACGFVLKEKLNIVRLLLFVVCGAMFVHGQILHMQSDMLNFNFEMAYIVVLGAVAFSLLNRKNYAMFFSFYGFSIAYTLLHGIVSNTGIMATSMTLIVAGTAGIIFIVQLIKELIEQYEKLLVLRIVSTVILSGLLLFQCASQLHVRMQRQYWDAPMSELTYTVRTGAAKGTITSERNGLEADITYLNLTQLLKKVDTEGKSFMCCTSEPSVYLDADLDFATFSAWTFGYKDALGFRVMQYQNKSEDHVPDIVFCRSQNDILSFIDDRYEQYTYNGSYLFVKK